MDWLQTVHWLPTFLWLLTAGMIAVIILDTATYTISNTLNLFLLGLYPFAVYTLGIANWPLAVVAAGIVLVFGLGVFALGFMGGGDVKLLVVLSLWIGWSGSVINFLFLTAIFGGVLVVVVLLARFFVAPLWRRLSPTRSLPRILTAKQPVPYGIAIAGAFLLLLWNDQIPTLHS